jgi:hypothetical protein
LAAGLLGLAVAGCGGEKIDPNLGKVEGTVKFNGSPLPKGTINFMMGTKGSGTAPIDAAGHYAISTPLPPGDYKVSVRAMEAESKFDAQGKTIRGKSMIPEKYVDFSKSGLTAKVEKGKNKIDFDLKP